MATDRPSLLRRLSGGDHPWGSYETVVGRFGVRRCRLLIYPPGTQTAERCQLRAWRAWPTGGAVVGFLTVMITGGTTSSPAMVVISAVTVYLVVAAALFVLTGSARKQVRLVSLTLFPGDVDAAEQEKFTGLAALASALTRADRLLAEGVISPVEHEAVWWQAYDAVGAPRCAQSAAHSHGSKR